jgi:hypothetical protein
VRRTVGSWGLSREHLLAVLDRLLHELPSDPDRHLRQRIVPLDLWSYRSTLGQAPFRLFFMFAVERDDQAHELRVVGTGGLTQEGPSWE